MERREAIRVGIIIAIATLLTGCVSTPKAPETQGVVFPQPVEKAQKAATDALVVLGFDVRKQEPRYVEGFRPRKVGLFVGSGGESVGIWLESLGLDRTRVRVDTARSFAGYAGQKKWNTEVLAEMEKTLGKAQ